MTKKTKTKASKAVGLRPTKKIKRGVLTKSSNGNDVIKQIYQAKSQ